MDNKMFVLYANGFPVVNLQNMYEEFGYEFLCEDGKITDAIRRERNAAK